MTPDTSGERQEKLAVMLTALTHGVQGVQYLAANLDSGLRTVKSFPASTPRLYVKCAPLPLGLDLGEPVVEELTIDFQTATLDFEGPAFELPSNSFAGQTPLSFCALLKQPERSPRKVLVTIAIMNRPYGFAVHTMLARRGLAPRLHGVSSVNGLPDALVMERPGGNWMTLSQARPHVGSDDGRSRILRAVMGICDILDEFSLVHGNISPHTIVVDMETVSSSEVALWLVGFESSGQVGKARYPFTNSDIGIPGGLIDLGADRRSIESWWKQFWRRQEDSD
jgi:hypothetical protein